MGIHLVLGGARSGKSDFAKRAVEIHAAIHNAPKVFIATAEARDDEMRARIKRHREDRAGDWRLIEAPLLLAEAIEKQADEEAVLIDCLTLWLSNSMLAEDGHHEDRMAALPAALQRRRGDTWLVSNEVGFGVVPDNVLARRYRDDAGLLHQALARDAETVALVVAGLPLALKSR